LGFIAMLCGLTGRKSQDGKRGGKDKSQQRSAHHGRQ